MQARQLGVMTFDRWEIVASEHEMAEALYAYAVAKGHKLPPWNPDTYEFDHEDDIGEFALTVRIGGRS